MIKFNAKDKNGDKIAEARRHSERHGDGFAKTVSGNLEDQSQFCGVRGASAPPPSSDLLFTNVVYPTY